MYSVQVPKFLHSFTKIFYFIGVWQSDEQSSVRKPGKKLFYSLFGSLIPIFFSTNCLLCDDRNEFIFLVQITILLTVLYVKLLYLLLRQKEILEFLSSPVIVHVHSIENREEYEQTKGKIEKFMKFAKPFVYVICFTASLTVCIALPVFSNANALPMLISFSWNDSEIIYWLAFVFVSLTLFLSAVSNLIAVLIWYIMLNYSIDYQLLGNKLSNFGIENKKNVKLSPRGSVLVEDLIVWIKAHRKLIDAVERFRSCFSSLFLAQITTSGICICISIYNLAFLSNDNIFQTELYVAILVYCLFDIFLVMYLANEITDASDRLSYCLFESNWIEQTESCKKYVLIIGEALKQPQQLVILIYPLNLETFISIVKGAYSMFNILMSFQ